MHKDGIHVKLRQGKTIWFTGLPGAGKTTLSSLLRDALLKRGVSAVVLDGDVLREGLNRDLGFSPLDRAENIRRAGEVAKILSSAGHVVIAAFITPLDSLRQAIRGMFEPDAFVEVFVDCPLAVCESRDPRGMYRRARSGEIPGFTGVSSPFETPCCSEVKVPTGDRAPEESLDLIVAALDERFPDLRTRQGHVSASPTPATRKRVVVIGLDGVPPSLVFGPPSEGLPNLHALIEHGFWGPLRSTDPPITIPAWASMTTGKDPGELGIYGFRNRRSYGYEELTTVNGSHVQPPRVWEYLEATGRSSILLGVPQTFPVQPHRGITVAGFPFPEDAPQWVYPPDLGPDLAAMAGGHYMPDVKGFRTEDKERLLREINLMVERRFRVACKLLVRPDWDFFMMVEIAPDRIHHGFWRYSNPDHGLHQPGNRYENVIAEFYRYLDAWIGSLLGRLDDNTTVFVVSDHGAMTMAGGVCVNDWLIQNGFLVLSENGNGKKALTPDMIDWERTKAWSEGGYYARIFLNVRGREPRGTVEPAEYESMRDALSQGLRSIPDENGSPMRTAVFKPESLYRTCRNVPPDLMVYFDGLARRSIGTVGNDAVLVPANDTGPDDANHSPEGIFIATRLTDLRRGIKRNIQVSGASCLDVTPTILHEFGLSPQLDLAGTVIELEESPSTACRDASRSAPLPSASRPDTGSAVVGYTLEEEEMVKKRLMDLGYI
jgi:adenylyl-sulfate kinase